MKNEIFLNNKYSKWYFNIINNPILENYNENHHIIPRSCGGSDDADNLVMLSARQHFICHLLLPKMMRLQKHKNSMRFALRLMSFTTDPINNRRYKIKSSRLIESIRNCHKGIPKSEATKQRISDAAKNRAPRQHTEETKQKIGNAHRGRTLSNEHKQKIAATLTGKETWMKNKKHSKESLLKMSESQKNRIRKPASKHSPKAIENNKNAQLKFVYTVQSPAGDQFFICDMKQFCLDNNLPYHRLVDKKQIGKPIKDSGHIKNKSHIGWMTVAVIHR